MIFDGIPNDSELVCLLSDQVIGPIKNKTVEEGGVLTVRPQLLPMGYMVPWMIFVAAVMTCMACFMPWPEAENRFSSMAFWFNLFFGWCLMISATLGLALVNHMLVKAGDCFRVDLAHRRLELCRRGRAVEASELVAVTLLSRYYDLVGAWASIYQTGVLVRSPDKRVELLPVVTETCDNIRSSQRSRWADRLASIFQVPVRRIELNKSESKALNDC